MYKVGVYAVTPFTNKSKKELDSPKGYAKEVGNAATGALFGATTGGVVGAGVGLVAGNVPGALVGAGAGALFGGISGAVKSIRSGEEEAGAKKSGDGKFFGRAATTIGTAGLGALVGGAIGHRLGGTKGSKAGIMAGGLIGGVAGDTLARSRQRKDDSYRYLAQYR